MHHSASSGGLSAKDINWHVHVHIHVDVHVYVPRTSPGIANIACLMHSRFEEVNEVAKEMHYVAAQLLRDVARLLRRCNGNVTEVANLRNNESYPQLPFRC